MTVDYSDIRKLLEEIIEDSSIPKTISDELEHALKFLRDKHADPNHVKDIVIQILEGIISDPNLPVYARSQIWCAVSMLSTDET